ncbi:MAG: GIY-YIG nuclease family protein [Candidatus Aminicenantes bacterium]|nr:MAG: GIY-YIG nuclease family protein [Candidatus Aminicenantes bacterium]
MKKLNKLAVLTLDCQATHSNPAIGYLAEIGWVKTQANHTFDHEMTTENVESHLVKVGKNVRIPKQFLRMTGIKPEEWKDALSKKVVWQKLYRMAKRTSSENRGICPAVIHFSRYEEPYLKLLHQEFAPNIEFPFTVLCTHEIISRLYPGLPRKSLRAAAGFLGFSLPNLRRSLHHVVATAFIWNHIVRILEEQEKIVAFEELRDWLRNTPPPTLSKQRARDYPMEKALLKQLPDEPGIYRMYRSTGDLLYIGKAKSLKHRVNSYFQKKCRHAEHILEMLSQAQNLSTTVTQTALEAAVRESDDIKRQSPPYNRALQPSERQIYFYSKDFKSHQTEPNIQHPVGPFPSNIKMESLAKLIDVLNGKIRKFSPRLIETILDILPEHAPEKECFESGLEAFKKEYCAHREMPINVRHVMKWGTQFWQEKLIEQELEKEIKEAEEDQEEGWTPERVFKAQKRIIRMGSFQIRRSRWFCRLSESSISWSKPNGSEEDKHVLIFEKGATNFRYRNPLSGVAGSPPGHKKTLLQRQSYFDIATYDRMRIVTTEMRRIIQEGRNIELKLHPGNTLNKEQLQKILKWV